MTQQQKDFFNKVIKPKLIEMAINGTLPSDMNEINEYYFEGAAEKYNEENPTKILVKVDGGIVQDVIQNIGEHVDVDVIDGDIEAVSEDSLIEFEEKEYYIYEGDVNVYSPEIIKKFEDGFE